MINQQTMPLYVNNSGGKLIKRIVSAFLSVLLLLSPISPSIAQAQEFEEFLVKDIRIDGLRRFDPGVIFSRINITIGDNMTENKSIEIIKSLFDTGFFGSVEVLREENILVIKIEENPTIAEVNFAGISEIPDETLQTMLQSAGIVKARVFDRALVEAAVKALEEIYIERSFYKIEVNPVVSPLPRNRVALLFEVDEGKQAAIRSIDITGNEEFSDWTLKRVMNLESRGLLNYFGDNYLFSESRLEADLERIRTLYLENGYLRFQVEARQAEVSPNKEHIDIRIRINEGSQYLLAAPQGDGETFTGDIPSQVTYEDLHELILQVEGEVFSSQKATETTQLIRDLLGDYGYAFASVSYNNELNDEEGVVEVTYKIDPGNPSYVRRIIITGNERTRDGVIRREMLQFERERYSRHKVESSHDRIRRLGFFSNAEITQEKVEGSEDELDLLVKVTESSVGSFRIGAGFSSDNNISFEAGLDTPNIFGSGDNFKADLTLGDDNKRIDLALDQFYHTKEGISRHLGLSIAERESTGESSGYSIDGYSAEYGYGIPYADNGKYSAVFSYEKINVNSVSSQYQDFADKHGNSSDLALLKTSLVHDTRDSAQSPTSGYRIDASSEIGLPVFDLQYYKVDYVHDYYYQARSIWTQPVWHIRGGAGFGDSYGGDVYPFYHRYYVGGVDSLRGFDSNSIGVPTPTRTTIAMDGSTSTVTPPTGIRGGKSRLYGSIEATIDTELFKTQKVYVAPFIDFGTAGTGFGKYEGLRAAAGVEIRWVSPIGPLRFSWAKALIKEAGDKTQDLQFSVRY